MTDALNALADRIEAATGPDRELDMAIYRLACPAARPGALGEDGFHWNHPPIYTASLDAALTLVPDEHDIQFMQGFGEPALATIVHRSIAKADERQAATPALAICAAALRARAAQGTEARSGETERLDPKGDGPVAKPCA